MRPARHGIRLRSHTAIIAGAVGLVLTAGLFRILPWLETGLLIRGAATIAATHDLPAVECEPYVHVIIDRSETSGFSGDVEIALRSVKTAFPAAHRVRVTSANYDVVDPVSRLAPWNEAMSAVKSMNRMMPRSGGFALDLALAHALRMHRDADLDGDHGAVLTRPIFVILSQMPTMGSLDIPIASEWAQFCSTLEVYQLGGNGVIVRRRGAGPAQAPVVRVGTSVRPLGQMGVAVFAKAGRSADAEYWSPADDRWRPLKATVHSPDNAWSRAAGLEGESAELARDPAAGRLRLASLVRASRTSGVLLPQTSYIVVENDSQWRQLALSERQRLGQNAALEFQETSGPSAVLVSALFAAYVLARGVRRRYLKPALARTAPGARISQINDFASPALP